MHPAALPPDIIDRVRARRGRLHPFDRLSPTRTALAVIDMQNAFCAPGAAIEVPVARSIVPNINRLAAAVRASGGMVVWVQMTIKGEADWPVFLSALVDAGNSTRILAELKPGSEGHKLWPECEALPADLVVAKNRFSAFLPSACDLCATLRARGIESVLIAGTLTNVCSESSARDAAMQDFKTTLVSDANAARSDDEHLATLITFIQSFGDVRTTDELVGFLRGQS
ncbi:MAG TPA: isochorismatase family cysteine hydrolase [Stellaceae bacterium]|nr:isochorismatase family cysteine hydrolase [Stellaceae bacterium]